MQLKELKKKSGKSILKNVLPEKPIKTIIPDEIVTKIKYLCNIISEVEWSGVLLYQVEGSVRDIDNMTITVKDIILMDKGTTARTGYSFNEEARDQSGYTDRHIDYCEENEEALEWNIGLIHSHGAMGVFFSAVDNEELKTNAPNHNCYLSIIVNNKTDIIGKLAYVAKASFKGQAQYKALDSNGIEFDLEPEDFSFVKDKLITIDCDIIANKEIDSFTFFEKNVFDVIKPKPVQRTGYSQWGNLEDAYPKDWTPSWATKESIESFKTIYTKTMVMDEIETLLSSLLIGYKATESVSNFEESIKKAYTEKRAPATMLKNNIVTDFKRVAKQVYALDDEEFDMNVLSILQECTEYLDYYPATTNFMEQMYIDILYEGIQKVTEEESKRLMEK